MQSFESTRSRIGFYALIVLFILLVLLPIVWIFKLSIISQGEMQQTPPTILPHSFDLTSYQTAFGDSRFVHGIINSVIIAGITTVVCLVVGSVAAYALARLHFTFKAPVLSLILAIAFFPQVAIIGPLFLQFTNLNLIDTYWAMIIPDTVFALPLTVYLLVAYFQELPAALEEAAKVDGASTLQVFFRITLPLSIPGVVTTGLLTFIFAWNEFLFANTFAFSEATQPATVAIPTFATTFTQDYGAQAAASLVVTVPLVLLVLLFQRRIVSGLTAGATTG
jgi:trehalose/maltose transport system permease protein